jgi:hypothetical protein
VTGGKCCRFIEKEQLRVVARIHDFACDILELKQARDPGIPLRTRDNLPGLVMEATSVAHQHSPCGGTANLTFWIDPVLQRHGASRCYQ